MNCNSSSSISLLYIYILYICITKLICKIKFVAGIKFEMSSFVRKIVKFLSLNICYVICVVLWIKYWLMWFEFLLVFILFKFKKRPNISGIRFV